MKKAVFPFLLLLVCLTALPSCRETNAAVRPAAASLPALNSTVPPKSDGAPETSGTSAGTVDRDLTVMNSTMVYAEVYQMMNAPDQYLGKTIRVRGVFTVLGDPEGGVVYPAVYIADASACCAQGLEFLLSGNPAYPQGYPSTGTEITVTGRFETYTETVGGTVYRYCHLVDATLG